MPSPPLDPAAGSPEQSERTEASPSELELAFARGDFASVRRKAQAVLADADAPQETKHDAELWQARTEPPGAARFALWLTLALVLSLSVYFAFLRPHP